MVTESDSDGVTETVEVTDIEAVELGEVDGVTVVDGVDVSDDVAVIEGVTVTDSETVTDGDTDGFNWYLRDECVMIVTFLSRSLNIQCR